MSQVSRQSVAHRQRPVSERKGPPQGGGRPPAPAGTRRRALNPFLTDAEMRALRILAAKRDLSMARLVAEVLRAEIQRAGE